jgi:transposase InsO family protein
MLTFTPAGLTPAEHASLRWTHYGQNIRTRLPTGDYAAYHRPHFGLSSASLSQILTGNMDGKSCGREVMDWKHLLAYITGTVDQELLLRNEYLVTENRILQNQLKGRIRLSDGERKALAGIGYRLGKQALREVATIVKPDTILGWHRKLVAQKFDGSTQRQFPGRPKIDPGLEALVVRMAQENRSWGYDRIVGALANLGYTVSDQTVGNILKRHGIPPAPERKTTTTWKEFIRTHLEVLVATDFFTAEVWTLGGLVTYYVLFFIHLGSRKIQVAGVTPHPNEAWIVQVARNVTMEEWGLLSPGQYLIHDRDTKFCAAFQRIIDDAGIERVVLPPRSPNLNAYAERWVRSVKDEALSRVILFGKNSLWHVLNEYVDHYHQERNHQGKGNVLLFPRPRLAGEYDGLIQCRERLGGLLKYYKREAA